MLSQRFAVSLGILACLAYAANADEKPAYSVLGADNGHVAIVNSAGEVEWEFANKAEVHDLVLLANGNVMFPTDRTTIVEMTREKKVVWKYEAKPKDGYKGRIEIHAFQRLEDGNTIVAESGNGRIVEVDREGKVVLEVPLTVEHPNPHRDTRMARKLENGNYLLHEGDGKIREYDAKGKVSALRHLRPGAADGWPRGARHRGTGPFGYECTLTPLHGNRVIEVTPEGDRLN